MDLQSRWVFSGATVDSRDIAENEVAFIGDYLKVKKVAVMNGTDEFSQSLSHSVAPSSLRSGAATRRMTFFQVRNGAFQPITDFRAPVPSTKFRRTTA